MELCCRNRGTCCRWNPSPSALLITAWLGFWIQQTSGQATSKAEVVNAILSENVTFVAPVYGRITTFSWHRGEKTEFAQTIVTYFQNAPRQSIGRQYTGRETALFDGSLHITDVDTNDVGYYSRYMLIERGPAKILIKELKVYERISVPIIYAEPEVPIENEPLILFCRESSVTVVFYQWFRNDSMVSAGGRISLSNDSQTLALSSCIMSDSGTNFTCRAYNAASNASSRPFIISFEFKGHASQPSPILPAWAIVIIVMVVLSSVLFSIALIRHHFIKTRLPVTDKQHKQQKLSKRPAQAPGSSASASVPSVEKVKVPGQNGKKKTVRFDTGTKLDDSPASSEG